MAQKISPKLFRLSNNLDWISKWSINFNNKNYIKLIFFDIFFSIYYIYIFKRKKILSNVPQIIRSNNSFILISTLFLYKKRIFIMGRPWEKKTRLKKKKMKLNKFQYFNLCLKKYSLIFYHNLSLLLKNNNILLIIKRRKHTVAFWFFTAYLGDIIRFNLKRKKKFFRLIFLLKKKLNIDIKKNHLKKLLGVKIKIVGKINGKDRARSVNITKGALKFNTIQTHVEYECFHMKNIHGMYGVHLWFSFSKILIKKKNYNFFFLKFKIFFNNYYKLLFFIHLNKKKNYFNKKFKKLLPIKNSTYKYQNKK